MYYSLYLLSKLKNSLEIRVNLFVLLVQFDPRFQSDVVNIEMERNRLCLVRHKRLFYFLKAVTLKPTQRKQISRSPESFGALQLRSHFHMPFVLPLLFACNTQ